MILNIKVILIESAFIARVPACIMLREQSRNRETYMCSSHGGHMYSGADIILKSTILLLYITHILNVYVYRIYMKAPLSVAARSAIVACHNKQIPVQHQ
jgi:hypothetical protein